MANKTKTPNIHTFICEDGQKRGAMRGCVQLFPVSLVAKAEQALRERERDLQTRFGKDATLNAFDRKALAVIEEFYAGTMTEQVCLLRLRGLTAEKTAWRKAKTSRRAW